MSARSAGTSGRRRAATLGLVCALGATAASAAPSGPHTVPLTVLELASDDARETDAQALTNELRQAVLESAEHSLPTLSPSVGYVAERVHCDSRPLDRGGPDADRTIDAGCERSMAARLGASLLLWGHLYERAGALYAKVHLYREGKPGRVITVPYDRAQRARAARRLYAKLATPEQVGDVRLGGAAGLAGAELWVDGKAEGPYAPGAELTLSAGEHALEVRREGKAVARAKATVVAERASEVRLAPVEAPPVPTGSTSPPVGPPPVETRGSWQRPAGFFGLGLGAALVGAGVVASLRVRALDDDFASGPPIATYRGGLTGVDDACDAAEAGVSSLRAGAATAERVDRLCSAVSTFRAAQYVFYGTGLLLAGAGAYLIATSPSASNAPSTGRAPTVSLRPWAGSVGGGLSLQASF